MAGNSVAFCLLAVRIIGIAAWGILGECAMAALDDIPLAMVLLIDTDLEGIVTFSVTGTVGQARDAACSVGQVEREIMHPFIRMLNRRMVGKVIAGNDFLRPCVVQPLRGIPVTERRIVGVFCGEQGFTFILVVAWVCIVSSVSYRRAPARITFVALRCVAFAYHLIHRGILAAFFGTGIVGIDRIEAIPYPFPPSIDASVHDGVVVVVLRAFERAVNAFATGRNICATGNVVAHGDGFSRNAFLAFLNDTDFFAFFVHLIDALICIIFTSPAFVLMAGNRISR